MSLETKPRSRSTHQRHKVVGFQVLQRGHANLVVKRYPNLTIEGFVSELSFNDTEREHLIRTMRSAGFPACAKPEALARLAQPVG